MVMDERFCYGGCDYPYRGQMSALETRNRGSLRHWVAALVETSAWPSGLYSRMWVDGGCDGLDRGEKRLVMNGDV